MGNDSDEEESSINQGSVMPLREDIHDHVQFATIIVFNQDIILQNMKLYVSKVKNLQISDQQTSVYEGECIFDHNDQYDQYENSEFHYFPHYLIYSEPEDMLVQHPILVSRFNII